MTPTAHDNIKSIPTDIVYNKAHRVKPPHVSDVSPKYSVKHNSAANIKTILLTLHFI